MEQAQNTIYCSAPECRKLDLLFSFILLFTYPADFLNAQTTDQLKDRFDEALRLYQFGDIESSRNLFNDFTDGICYHRRLIDACIESQLYLSTFQRIDRNFEAAKSYIDAATGM